MLGNVGVLILSHMSKYLEILTKYVCTNRILTGVECYLFIAIHFRRYLLGKFINRLRSMHVDCKFSMSLIVRL